MIRRQLSYGFEQLSLESVDLQRQCVDGVCEFSSYTMVLVGLSAQFL